MKRLAQAHIHQSRRCNDNNTRCFPSVDAVIFDDWGGCARLAAECKPEECRACTVPIQVSEWPAAMAAKTSNSSSASCHNGRHRTLFYYRIRPWKASATNCRLAFCGRHGSELLLGDLTTWCSPCGGILSLLLAWAGGVAQYAIRASRGLLRPLTGDCALTREEVVEDQRSDRLPISGQALFSPQRVLSSDRSAISCHRFSRGSTVVALAMNLPRRQDSHVHAHQHKRLGRRWTTPATYTRLVYHHSTREVI